jgi:hypothetical protein
MMVVARRNAGIPASLMTHSHYLTQCVLAIAGWRGLGLHETRKIQESRGTRNSSDMKIARTLTRWPQAAGMLFEGSVRIGGERCLRGVDARSGVAARSIRFKQDFWERCCGHFWEVRVGWFRGTVCSTPWRRRRSALGWTQVRNRIRHREFATGSKFDGRVT